MRRDVERPKADGAGVMGNTPNFPQKPGWLGLSLMLGPNAMPAVHGSDTERYRSGWARY